MQVRTALAAATAAAALALPAVVQAHVTVNPRAVPAGDVLAFPALQTYADGEVVRWTGRPDAERPAPRVTLTEAAQAHASHTGIVRRTPAPGSTVGGPRSVSLKLAQGVLGGGLTVRRDGRRVAATASGLKPGDRTVVRATFARALAPGAYGVSWHALSADGHRLTGSWSFSVR